jgi:GNAT superfamily N-acetyltransferase
MSSDRAGYEVRAARPEDLNFIRATFLKGLYHGDTWFSLIPKSIFMEHYHPVIERLIATNDVWVACLADAPDVIIGYSIVSKDFTTIHWVFVKKGWRKMGIARSIVPRYPEAVTHLTPLGKTLMTKFENCVFNPFRF